MNAWYCAGALLLGMAASGCRTNLSRDLLEQELRMQEDKIYALQGEVEDYQRQLDACQLENQSLLKARTMPAAQGGKLRRRRIEVDEELDVPAGKAPPYDGPPVISPPDPNVPDGESPDDQSSGADGADSQSADEFDAAPRSNMRLPSSTSEPGEHKTELPQFELPAGDEAPGDDKTAGDGSVRRITLNRKLTGGRNADGQPGDEGVMVVVEPLDSAGELLEVPGEISVVLLDPAQEGEAARIARWDFTAEEAAEHLKRTPLGDGLHFDLRWPEGPPVNRMLNLYVRYKTAEGKQLQVEKQIEVNPQGMAAAPDSGPAWTKTDKPFPGGEAEASSDALAPRAKATSIRPAPEESAPKASSKAPRQTERPKSDRSAAPKWTPYR
jgi:hypothetical protein